MVKALTMADVKRGNEGAGFFWFSPATMRFFQCKIESGLIGGKFFVTSEQSGWDSPRLYSIRKYNPKTCGIDTVGDFQAFKTAKA